MILQFKDIFQFKMMALVLINLVVQMINVLVLRKFMLVIICFIFLPPFFYNYNLEWNAAYIVHNLDVY